MNFQRDAPCFKDGADCENRRIGCHTACEKWKAYEKKRNEGYHDREVIYHASNAFISSKDVVNKKSREKRRRR